MRTIKYRTILLSFLFLISVAFITSCKKDSIQITADRTYIEIHINVIDGRASGTTMLTLRPDGTCGIAPGGDIVYMGKYDISGDRLSISVEETNRKFKFTIVSDEELHGQNGEVLRLDKDQ